MWPASRGPVGCDPSDHMCAFLPSAMACWAVGERLGGGTVILEAGQGPAGAVDSAAMIGVRAPARVVLTCGGVDMVVGKSGLGDGAETVAEYRGGAPLGKSYVDDAAALEGLCTRAGVGALAVDGRVRQVAAAEPLPSSD